MSEKLSVNEIVERLRTLRTDGSPQELSEKLGVPNDKSLARALKKLILSGELIAGGSTRSRFFIWASSEDVQMQAASKVAIAALKAGADPKELIEEGSPPDVVEKAGEEISEIDRALLGIIPCTSKTFSAKAHEFGITGDAVHRTKRRLKLLTMKQRGADWMKDKNKVHWIVDHEEHAKKPWTEPERIAGGFGAARDLGIQGGKGLPGYRRNEAFGVMGTRANKTGHPIGSGKV